MHYIPDGSPKTVTVADLLSEYCVGHCPLGEQLILSNRPTRLGSINFASWRKQICSFRNIVWTECASGGGQWSQRCSLNYIVLFWQQQADEEDGRNGEMRGGLLNTDYWRQKYVFIKLVNKPSHAWLVDCISPKFIKLVNMPSHAWLVDCISPKFIFTSFC
jgi:hypothetical protein